MESRELRELPLRAVGLAPLEPVALATAERFRSITLVADSPDTCRVARRTAREISRDWGLPLSSDDVELAVSELVGNAVHHATPDGQLTTFGGQRYVTIVLRAWSHWLFVEVSDEDSTPPMLPVGDPFLPEMSKVPSDELLREHGRGLFLVQCLADGVWWCPRETGGESVFCRFDLSGGGDA